MDTKRKYTSIRLLLTVKFHLIKTVVENKYRNVPMLSLYQYAQAAVETGRRLTCNFCKFFDNLLFCFAFGDGANKQSVVGHRDAHADGFTWSNFTVVALQKRREERQK